MIRFVIDPEGSVVPDVAERLPGRGLWVVAERQALATAVRRNAFARAARRAVKVPSDLLELVENRLVGRCQDRLGLARRAGKATFGYERVRERISSGMSGLLVEAFDGGPGDRRSLRAQAAESGGRVAVPALSSRELGAAFGRDTVVHVYLQAGALAEEFERDSERLARLRQPDDRLSKLDKQHGPEHFRRSGRVGVQAPT